MYCRRKIQLAALKGISLFVELNLFAASMHIMWLCSWMWRDCSGKMPLGGPLGGQLFLFVTDVSSCFSSEQGETEEVNCGNWKKSSPKIEKS